MTARDDIKARRRRRKRQDAWAGRQWGPSVLRRMLPLLLMKRETATAWTASAPGRGKSIVRYTSDGKPHVSPVFVYPDSPRCVCGIDADPAGECARTDVYCEKHDAPGATND